MKNTDKLSDIVHYVVARADGSGLGATKLNKVLWIADLISWRLRQRTVTGIDKYRRLPFGPVPTKVLPVLKILLAKGALIEKEIPTMVGVRKELFNIIEPNLSNLDAVDVDLLNIAISHVAKYSAKEISEQTHDEYWEEVPCDADMLVSAASLYKSQVDDEDISWAQSEMA